MDIHCPICGSAWDADELHAASEELFGDGDGEDMYRSIYRRIRADFRRRGCAALGARHEEPADPEMADRATAAMSLSAHPDDWVE